jgi:hypothetical protein
MGDREMKSGNLLSGILLVLVLTVAAMQPAATEDDDSQFMAENEAAMQRMMAAMNVKPSGDVDRDFVAMMIPHHQGAVDMAVLILRYGHNEQLRRIAQEIIVNQRQEIDAMRLALGQPLQAAPAQNSNPAPTMGAMHHHDPIREGR